MPSCSSGMRLRTGTVAVASSVVPMACPKPAKDAAMPRRSSWGKRGTCLRAPGLRLAVRDRHTTCKPWPVLTSLRDRSARPPYGGRTFTLLSIGQHRPAHAPRGSLRSAAPTSCIHPTRRASRCADRSSVEASHPGRSAEEAAPRPWGGRRSARTGPPRSFLPIAALPVPAGPGRNATPARASRTNAPTLQEAHAHECQARDPGLLSAQAGPHSPATRGQMRRLLLCSVVLLPRHSCTGEASARCTGVVRGGELHTLRGPPINHQCKPQARRSGRRSLLYGGGRPLHRRREA